MGALGGMSGLSSMTGMLPGTVAAIASWDNTITIAPNSIHVYQAIDPGS